VILISSMFIFFIPLVDCISFNILVIGLITRFLTKAGSYKKSFTFLSLYEKLVPFVVSLSLVSTCLVFLCVLGFVSNTQSERGNDTNL